ncbi:non-ribosomal peptide synthetase [Mycobacterium asiaticum]|uniref:Phenyloxazoline synthase MbtB n=1 Tax=Mycobacterium asiaticum TaxID=1790 RepID=A0A1A3NED6_MYCAS|nr:non-ribosomal peptide synthetase [Mycobacterium asiaticum]OBK19439.1 non-ribosomal peptide synthetase [Mycobacterium asiaticum]
MPPLGEEWISKDEIKATIAAQLGCAASEVADHDDLIQMGLNSIRMMALAGGWRKRGAGITFAELAASPTVDAWHGLLSGDQTGSSLPPERPEPAEPVADGAPFPLAPMQHAYWIGRSDEQELGGVAAHLYVEFDGTAIDPQRLERAVDALVEVHPMLRTRFLPDGTQQTMPRPGRAVFEVVDLRGRDATAVEVELAAMRHRKTHQRLAIEDGQVIDITLTLYGDRARVHLDVDMLAGDAMSYRVLVTDLAAAYHGAALPTPGYSYQRYRSRQQQDHGRDAARERDRQWWHQHLPEMAGAPELPVTRVGERATPHRTIRHDHWLPPQARQRLVTGAHARGVTPAAALAAVFADTVGGWSATDRFLLNVPLFQREAVHPDIDRVIGDFTASLMLEVDISENMSVAERAQAVQQNMYESGSHAAYSGLEVLRDLGRHRGEPVLAPVVFTSALDLGELFAENVIQTFGEPVWIISQGPQVLLDAQITELRGGLLINWDVREAAFPPGLVDAMFDRFTQAVRRLGDGESGWDAEAAVQLPVGQAKVRAAVNVTDGPVTGRCLHQGFFEHAAAHPDHPAVLWGLDESAGEWSYRQLAEGALAVAGALSAHGVGPGDAVAVQLPKGRDQILAVLGVLAAGAAYVPIGIDQPDARRAKILASAGVAAVLTVDGSPVHPGLACLSIDAARNHPEPLSAAVFPSTGAVAYVLFTSGSTGLPKGVDVPHSAAMNTIDAVNDWFDVGSSDRSLAFSALEFDLSVYDIFGMFSAGGAVVVVDDQQRAEATAWVELIRRHRVSILNCVPGILDMILEVGGDRLGDSLRAVILGGDWVGAELARTLARLVPGCRFAGLGGATETAIHSTICEVVGKPAADWTTVPFGVPLRNVRCRVVSPAGRDCLDWVPGELWVGGANVAAGYRNDPERTAERFVEHDGIRWYKTGDLARYWPDGTIEFLGRADHQVQIRGYRVELGEVENALRTLPGVRHAVAAVVGTNAPKLVAAIARDSVDSGDVTAALRDLLPNYMIPARIVSLERIPLTANGKLDRRAVVALLGESETPAESLGSVPRDDLEAALAEIVAEVLGVAAVGVHDDFFALGGDSVLATAAVARVRDWLDVDHAVVTDLFAARTVAGLAERLSKREAARGTPARLAVVARHYLDVAALTDEEVLAEG